MQFLHIFILFTSVLAFKEYKYYTYDEMVETMQNLNQKYPEIVDFYSVQERYNLSTPKELSCMNKDCIQYAVRITNEKTLDADRPELFFSGALHGNERIGPNAVLELMVLLAENANAKNPWILHLVNTRSITLMPMTNAYGYAHNTRGENGIDTNRDYNYMTAPQCMETMTSRAVNEIWRDHIFQLAITFHGGMRAIAYEWGSPNHEMKGGRSAKSPDDNGQYSIAKALSIYGGAFEDNTDYPIGTMNDIVYGVKGGFEDYAYAGTFILYSNSIEMCLASWENQYTKEGEELPFQPCEPDTYGGYPAEKTIYNNVTHRAFNILVETSNNKQPNHDLGNDQSLLGNNIQLFPKQPVGHIPRNIRLGLLLIDIVQPYVLWSHSPIYNEMEAAHSNDKCEQNAIHCMADECLVPQFHTIHFSWQVLGAFNVDETLLYLSNSTSSIGKPISGVQSGITSRNANFKEGDNAHFSACVMVSESPGKYFITAQAKVDQNWKEQGSGKDLPSPLIPPQSHVVNARTNPNWDMEHNGHRVRGKLYWTSKTIELVVLPYNASVTNMNVETEVASMAAALGYLVVGVGGMLVGIILTVLYERVFRTRIAYQPTLTADTSAPSPQAV